MDKYVEIIKLLERIFGKSAVGKSLGTRTNVVRFPKGKQPLDPTTRHFDVAATAENNPDLVKVIKNSIEDRMGDITRMNDQELLTYKQNLQRLADYTNPLPLPTADVIEAGSKQRVTGEGLEKLIKEQGLIASPKTPIGKIDLMNKQLLQKVDKLFPSEETLQKEEAARKALLEKKYEGKGFAGGVFGPSGIYRSVARDFLLDQNAKGAIKLNPETIKALEERSYISGGQSLIYPDPIRVMRYHYGDDVFDKIPVDELKKTMGARSDILEAMSKVEAKPVKVEAPKTPGGYMTPGEMLANIEEYKNIEGIIRRRESRFADMTDEEILNELGHYGSQRTAYETALQFDHPDAYEKYLIQQGKGGDIKSALKNYQYREKPNLSYEFGKEPKEDLRHIADDMAEYLYQKEFSQLSDDIKTKLLDAANEEYMNILSTFADGGRVGYADGGSIGLDYLMGMDSRPKYKKGGDVKKLLDLIAKTNKELKGKKSMETVNPKTGEVTVPKEPVKTAERKTIEYDAMEEANKLSLKHKEAAYAFDEIQPIDIYDKIAPDRVAEIMAEIKGKDYYDLSKKQQSELYKKAQSFLDDYKKIDRINTAVKKFNAGQELQAMDKKYLSQFVPESEVTFESKVDKSIWKKGDPITEENFGSTPFAPSQESLDNLEKARKMSSEMSLEKRMNQVLNQYDKSMFKKNEQGMVDVTDSENIEKMALLLKRDHPEIYNEIFKLTEDLDQKQILENFDITGRKPNKDGGLNHLLGF